MINTEKFILDTVNKHRLEKFGHELHADIHELIKLIIQEKASEHKGLS